MVTNASKFLTTQFAEFLVKPLRMLRILTTVLRSLQMTCHQYEYLAMLPKTIRIIFLLFSHIMLS